MSSRRKKPYLTSPPGSGSLMQQQSKDCGTGDGTGTGVSGGGGDDDGDSMSEFLLDDDAESVDLVTDLRAVVAAAADMNRSAAARSPPSAEELLDYESVSSPGGSSTASGPIYVRPAGFEHHAQEVVAAAAAADSGLRGHVAAAASSRSGSVLSRHNLGVSASSASSLAGSPRKAGGGMHVHAASGRKKKGLLSAEFAAAAGAEQAKKIEGVPVLSQSHRSKQRKGRNSIRSSPFV